MGHSVCGDEAITRSMVLSGLGSIRLPLYHSGPKMEGKHLPIPVRRAVALVR
jgi:hypothetical protein